MLHECRVVSKTAKGMVLDTIRRSQISIVAVVLPSCIPPPPSFRRHRGVARCRQNVKHVQLVLRSLCDCLVVDWSSTRHIAGTEIVLRSPRWYYRGGTTEVVLPRWYYRGGTTEVVLPRWYYRGGTTEV